MLRPRLVRTARRAAAALVLAVLPLVPGCGGGPDTPEELFELGCRVTNEGRHGAFYDLLSKEQRADFQTRMDGMRDTLRRNPGARNLAAQFNTTYEEFLVLPYRDLWAQAHKGTETVLVGARIIDRTTDPVTGRDVAITFETTSGQQFRWIMRYDDEAGGWRFQNQLPVKLEDTRDR